MIELLEQPFFFIKFCLRIGARLHLPLEIGQRIALIEQIRAASGTEFKFTFCGNDFIGDAFDFEIDIAGVDLQKHAPAGDWLADIEGAGADAAADFTFKFDCEFGFHLNRPGNKSTGLALGGAGHLRDGAQGVAETPTEQQQNRGREGQAEKPIRGSRLGSAHLFIG